MVPPGLAEDVLCSREGLLGQEGLPTLECADVANLVGDQEQSMC